MSVFSGNKLVTVGHTDFERILFKILKSSRNFRKCLLEAITNWLLCLNSTRAEIRENHPLLGNRVRKLYHHASQWSQTIQRNFNETFRHFGMILYQLCIMVTRFTIFFFICVSRRSLYQHCISELKFLLALGTHLYFHDILVLRQIDNTLGAANIHTSSR